MPRKRLKPLPVVTEQPTPPAPRTQAEQPAPQPEAPKRRRRIPLVINETVCYSDGRPIRFGG